MPVSTPVPSPVSSPVDGGDGSTPRGGSFTPAPTMTMTCKTISVYLESAEEFDGVYVMVRACGAFVFRPIHWDWPVISA